MTNHKAYANVIENLINTNMNVPFRKTLIIFISVATLVGLALHETKTDKLTTALIGIPAIMATYGGASLAALHGEAHTHVEHFSMAAVQRVHQTTYVPPRALEHKKHLLQKSIPKGHHPFDNYILPVVS